MAKIPGYHQRFTVCLFVYITTSKMSSIFGAGFCCAVRWNGGLSSHFVTAANRTPASRWNKWWGCSPFINSCSIASPGKDGLQQFPNLSSSAQMWWWRKMLKYWFLTMWSLCGQLGESCGVCWEKKSYCSNQDLVQLPTLFLNLQHK